MSRKEIKQYHLDKEQTQSLEFGLQDFQGLKNANLCLNQEPHNHSFYQIIFFKETQAKHFIDFNEYKIQPDSLIFIAKNQVHFFEQGVDYDGFLVHFNESFLIASDKDINFFLTYHLFNNKAKPYFNIPDKLKPQINLYFQQIQTELDNIDTFGTPAILSNLLKSLLLIIEREIRKEYQEDTSAALPNPIFLSFRDSVEKNFKNGWTVAEYANDLSISTKTLNSIVKKEAGQTASHFITGRVILESKRRLTHTNIQINQIAYDMGFSDPYYFMKFFKKQVGSTPKEFRKSVSEFSQS